TTEDLVAATVICPAVSRWSEGAPGLWRPLSARVAKVRPNYVRPERPFRSAQAEGLGKVGFLLLGLLLCRGSVGERRPLKRLAAVHDARVARLGKDAQQARRQHLLDFSVGRGAGHVGDLVGVLGQVVQLFRRSLAEGVVVVPLPLRVVA